MDALLGLLHPGWRIVIGLVVALAVVVTGYRMLRRGPSQMRTGMLLVVAAIMALVAVTVLLD
ncbi:MAG: hypothetical protein ACRDT6_12660 [Micromonosporaceae bacterium]